MIYCVGHRASYDRYFVEQLPEVPHKKGRDGEYPGGSVWKTQAEAETNCPADYAVYGVLADWETESVPSTGGPWNDLLVDAPLVQSPKK